VQSVVTYDTIIEFANPEEKLFPGMTAYVTIPVATVQNALKVPNTALRYKPPMSAEEILAIYKQYGIDGNQPAPAAADSSVAQASQQPNSEAKNLSRPAKADSAVVWKLHADNTMEPVNVSLGITDHAFTEILAVIKGDLKDGDAVVIRSIVPKNSGPGNLGR